MRGLKVTVPIKRVKLTPEEVRVLEIVGSSALSVRLWKSELRVADRLFELGLIARTAFGAEYAQTTAAGRAALEGRSGSARELDVHSRRGGK